MWISDMAECSICNYRFAFVIESDTPDVLVNLECAGCGNMTAHPVEDEMPEAM